MSLKWYLRPRIVALKSSTSVLNAARAEAIYRLVVNQLLTATGALIPQTVSIGQMEDVRVQLPGSLREVFFEGSVGAVS